MPKKAAPAYRGAVVGGPRCPIRVRKDDEMTVDTTTPRELGLRIKKEDGTFFAGAARIEFRIKDGEYRAGKRVDLTCALVAEERVPMRPLKTVNGLEVRAWELDFDRDALRARGQKSMNEVGTAARASDWHSGLPEDVQALLEADPVDEEALLQIFRTRYVGPSQFRALQNCHLRHCDFRNRWERCVFDYGAKGEAKGAEDKCAKQGAVNALTFRKGDWDTSAFFKSRPAWMQKGAKDSKKGLPWTGPRGDGRLDEYKVPDERGRQTKVRVDGSESHWGIGASGRLEGARDAAAARRKAAARPRVPVLMQQDDEEDEAVQELQALAGLDVDDEVEELDLFDASDNRQGRHAIRGMLTILSDHIRAAEGHLISVGFKESLRIGTPAELDTQRWWLLGDYERTGRKLKLDMDELWYQSTTYADKNDLVALEVFNERFFEQRWHYTMFRLAGHPIKDEAQDLAVREVFTVATVLLCPEHATRSSLVFTLKLIAERGEKESGIWTATIPMAVFFNLATNDQQAKYLDTQIRRYAHDAEVARGTRRGPFRVDAFARAAGVTAERADPSTRHEIARDARSRLDALTDRAECEEAVADLKDVLAEVQLQLARM
ncbi:unnamed protein product [Pelagomonas calceolata]|uniref:Uncharacterized protein n=1 Tax=Pelagomonas calceolata TaxID=35677 RepID=A0A7S4E675_9STRA|nr:unnamed protein product [Pelagomonas calceolata]